MEQKINIKDNQIKGLNPISNIEYIDDPIEKKVAKIMNDIFYNLQHFLDKYQKKEIDEEGRGLIYKLIISELKQHFGKKLYGVLASYLKKNNISLFIDSKYMYYYEIMKSENFLTIQFVKDEFWSQDEENDALKWMLNNRKKKWTVPFDELINNFLRKVYEDQKQDLLYNPTKITL